MDFLPWFVGQGMLIIGFICAVVVITERRQVGATLAWVLIMLLVPYVGVPLYLLIGGHRIRRVKARKSAPLPEYGQVAAAMDEAIPRRMQDVSSLMLRGGASPPRRGNRLRMITDAEEAYSTVLDLLDEAEESIEVCTYILGRDEVGRGIVEKLAQKAEEGLDVRLLVDGLGSWRASWRFLRPLSEAGGRTATFLRVLPFRRRASAHLRNHRKIIVTDHRTAVVGGMNLSSQYMGPKSDQPQWRDACMVLRGPAARELHQIFEADWQFATETETERSEPEPPPVPEGDGDSAVVQIAPGGPDIAEKPIYSGVMSAISQASWRVWVVTPFYVPDDVFATTLNLAARMGRDVRLALPRRSNMPLVDLAGRSYLDSLMEAGGKVYLYEEGLLHAKLLLVDDALAGVGSFNLDVRSFHLNFEVGAFVYGKEHVGQIADTVAEIQDECRLLDRSEFARRGKLKKFFEDTARLCSPLL